MLVFDEITHTYRLDDLLLKSVSSIVASQFKTFKANIVAANLENGKAKDQDSPYYGMTRHDILAKWTKAGDEARDNGTRLHRQIEEFYLSGKIPEEETVEWSQFMNFNKDHPEWTIVGCEVRVNNNKVAGTIDAIFQTPNGIVLVDWKRVRAIDYSGRGYGIGLMRYAEDCNYSKYSLQLSLYRELINMEVKDCFIVQFHPSIDAYSRIRAIHYEHEAKLLIS
jgi:ATP-dependent exoDNAse (exonuclease V) beta subunit